MTHGSPARGCAPGKGELMPQSIPLMAARLQRDVPTAESKVDDAIIALSSLMTSMVTARRESGAPAKTGQATILRTAKAQLSLVDVSSEKRKSGGEGKSVSVSVDLGGRRDI